MSAYVSIITYSVTLSSRLNNPPSTHVTCCWGPRAALELVALVPIGYLGSPG